MKLFAPYTLFISLGLALLSGSSVSSATHLDQVQPPGVYPHNTYTASYVWTQTTVDESTNNSQSSTQCKIVSSDGKGHLVCKSLDSGETIEILDLPTGKCYERSKYPYRVAKNSVTSYSSFSNLNEVMFIHDADVFNDVAGVPPNPVPKSIGSKLIDGHQCEGWKLITDHKIDEWWFDKQSKCLVLMESKPNPHPNPSMFDIVFWLRSIFFGCAPRTQTITERLDSFSVNPLPASCFNTKDLSPIKLTVWKMVENEPASNKKPEPDKYCRK